jgi:hypothetical protein
MVEAPGTAPGSEWLITKAIYRHSRLAPTELNIGPYGGEKKIDGNLQSRIGRKCYAEVIPLRLDDLAPPNIDLLLISWPPASSPSTF